MLVARAHPVVLAAPVALYLGLVAGVSVVASLLSGLVFLPLAQQVAGGLVLAGLAYPLWRALEWWRACYVVTDERVLLKKGVVGVRVSAVRLSRVTETSYKRSVAGRLLGYGVLELDSPGEQLGLASLPYLPRPDEVYRLITSLLIRQRPGPERRRVDPSEETTGPLPPVVL